MSHIFLGFIFRFDDLVNNFFLNLVSKDSFLFPIFKFITFFGSFEFVILFLIVFSAYYFYKESFQVLGKFSRMNILPIWASVLITSIIVFYIKYFFLTSGPAGRPFLEQDPSFPSAHAGVSVALFGAIYFMYSKKIRNAKLRKSFLFTILLVIFLIGLSRLVLNVHFFSDVVAGYLVGLFGLTCAIFLIKKLK